MKKGSWIRCTLFVGILVSVRSARADWYDDAKDIVTQLIEDELATRAIPNAARRIQAVCDFFPATVAGLEDKRYGGLAKILRKEVADAVGFVVWIDVKTGATKRTHTQTRPDAAQSKSVAALLPRESASALALMRVGTLTNTQRKAEAPPEKPQGACQFPSIAAGTADEDVASLPMATESKAGAELRRCLPTQASSSAEIACAAALLTRDALNGDERLLPADARRLAVALALEVLGTKLAQVQVTSPQLMSVAPTVAEALAAPQVSFELPTKLCSALGIPPGGPGSAFEGCVAAAGEGLAVLQHAQFNASAAKFDAFTLEQAFGAFSAVEQLCPTSACQTIGAIADGAETVVRLVQSKNYGAAAGEVFTSVQALACQGGSDQPGCRDQDKKVYAFLRSLAVYSIDSATSDNHASSYEADFRTAAVEMIESVSGGGVRRRLRTQWQWMYVPEFALRDAWRPGHIGNDTSAIFLYPSVDMIRSRVVLRVRRTFYLGIHGSLLDPIGPFIEVATRQKNLAKDPKATTVFGLGLLVPRLDFEAGVPDFSRNLVVGFGAAARLFRATPSLLDPTVARYCVVGTRCDDGSDSFTFDNLELSVFAKYAP